MKKICIRVQINILFEDSEGGILLLVDVVFPAEIRYVPDLVSLLEHYVCICYISSTLLQRDFTRISNFGVCATVFIAELLFLSGLPDFRVQG